MRVLFATLMVLLISIAAVQAAPVNDNFSQAIELPASNMKFGRQSITIMSGSNFEATVERGEPQVGSFEAASHSVWYKFKATQTGIALVTTHISQIVTQLEVFTGKSLTSLVRVGGDQAKARIDSSMVTFETKKNAIYYIRVDGVGSANETFRLTLNSFGRDGGVALVPGDLPFVNQLPFAIVDGDGLFGFFPTYLIVNVTDADVTVDATITGGAIRTSLETTSLAKASFQPWTRPGFKPWNPGTLTIPETKAGTYTKTILVNVNAGERTVEHPISFVLAGADEAQVEVSSRGKSEFKASLSKTARIEFLVSNKSSKAAKGCVLSDVYHVSSVGVGAINARWGFGANGKSAPFDVPVKSTKKLTLTVSGAALGRLGPFGARLACANADVIDGTSSFFVTVTR